MIKVKSGFNFFILFYTQVKIISISKNFFIDDFFICQNLMKKQSECFMKLIVDENANILHKTLLWYLL